MSKSLLLVPFLAVATLSAHAQENQADRSPIESCEHGKINTEDPSVLDSGDTEVEAGLGFVFADKAWDGRHLERRPFLREAGKSLKITHGFFDNFDAGIEGGLTRLEDKGDDLRKGQGPTDIAVNGRYRFINNETLAFEAAYIGGLTLPTGAQSNGKISISQRYWSFDQKLTAVKDWGSWTANADGGFSLPFGKHVDGERGTVEADIAVGYQILPWLQPEVEVNYAYSMNAHADSDVVALTVGVIMPLADTWCANAGVQQAVAGRNVARAAMVSFAVKKTF